MTKLEEIALKKLKLDSLEALGAERNEHQEILDQLTPEIIEALTVNELVGHVKEVYNDTVGEYSANSHNRDVTDDLLEFMYRFRENDLVLDVGCGTGRDALFMACPDAEFRRSLMQRLDGAKASTLHKYRVPTHALSVIGIDNCGAMLGAATAQLRALKESGKDHRFVQFQFGDMHDFAFLEDKYGPTAKFAGIWSCAALLTHTPRQMLAATIRNVAAHLKEGGVFSLSYTNGSASGHYDKLLISSTGRIKYFSHPDPAEVALIAAGHGLNGVRESYSDMVSGGRPLAKRLFVSQLYEKA